MQIIKLNATDSTNNYLKQLLVDTALEDFCVVTTNHQIKGKGQMGAEWISEKGKNLTFSVLKKNPSVVLPQQFLLSILVSLSIIKTLEYYNIPKLAIKWPNDILSDHCKISGILIENLIKSNKIDFSVIGIGLNVNQTFFSDFKRKATSIGLEKENTSNLQLTINNMLPFIAYQFDHLRVGRKNLDKNYLDNLYLSNLKRPYLFNGEKIEAVIKGVTPEGKLKLLSNSNRLILADLKAIEFL